MLEHRTLVIEGEMGIADAALLRQRMLTALAACSEDLCLDLGAVQSCDSAGVQLLLALRHSLAARGVAMHIGTAAPSVRDALSTYGLTDWLTAAQDVRAGDAA